jgi:hypothetical protein
MTDCTARGCPPVRGSHCHCAACHVTWGTLALFEAHQVTDYTKQPAVTCRPPSAITVTVTGAILPDGTTTLPDGEPVLELVTDAGGTWHTPAGLVKRQRLDTAAARARSRRSS